MSAPNIATLYDIESQYEDCLANFFANTANGVFGNVFTPRTPLTDEQFLVTPRLTIKAAILGLAATGSGWQETRANINNVANANYYSYYDIGLTFEVVTDRENTSQHHGLLRGYLRQYMLEPFAIMNANTVPYYQTTFVTPGPSTQLVDPSNDEITTQVQYDVKVAIPPSSFPNN